MYSHVHTQIHLHLQVQSHVHMPEHLTRKYFHKYANTMYIRKGTNTDAHANFSLALHSLTRQYELNRVHRHLAWSYSILCPGARRICTVLKWFPIEPQLFLILHDFIQPKQALLSRAFN